MTRRSSTDDLHGKVVLITGAAGGVGSSLARTLVERGSAVVLVDLDGVAAQGLADQLGADGAVAIGADVTDRASMFAAATEAVRHFGRLDVAVANAGILGRAGTFRDLEGDEARRVLEVNVSGVVNTVHAALDQVVANKGQVVVVSSVFAFINGASAIPYAMSKAAVSQLSHGLSVELAPHGASATTAYFALIETDLVHNGFDADVAATAVLDTYPRCLLRRMSKDGNYNADGRQRTEFRRGDVLVRRGTRAQRATRGDFAHWTNRAVEDARRVFLERVAFVADLPEGAQLQVAVDGTDHAEPGGMLGHAVHAWRQDERRLLGPTELAWLLVGEASLGELDDGGARLLVQSALRKKSTLWHWIARVQPSPEWVEEALTAALAGADRDVSDAGRPIVDLAAVFLDSGRYHAVLASLAASRHKHFRDAAEGADDKTSQLDRLRELAARPVDGVDLSTVDSTELRSLSHAAASQLLVGRDQAASNRLSRYGLESFRRTRAGAVLR